MDKSVGSNEKLGVRDLDGKRYKQWNYYYSSGKIKQASNYNYKGELHGFFITYDQFGKKVSEANYINDKLDGKYLEFFYNEKIDNLDNL